MDYNKILAHITTVNTSENINIEKTKRDNEEILNIFKKMDFNGDPCLLNDTISTF